MAELCAQVRTGVPIPPMKLTVADYLTEWVGTVAAKRVRASTLTAYRNYVNRYLVPGLGRRTLASPSARDVRSYLDQLDAGPCTVQYVHATLRAASEDGVRDDLPPRNVPVGPGEPSAGQGTPAAHR